MTRTRDTTVQRQRLRFRAPIRRRSPFGRPLSAERLARVSPRALRALLAACLPAALLLLVPTSAGATTVLLQPIEAQAEGADAAWHGVVAQVESAWEGGRIVTRTTVRDAIDLRAPGEPREVVIVTPGGRVGDLIQRVHGVEAYRPGDEVVVFSRALAAGTFRAMALTTSVFYVDRSGDQAIAVRRIDTALVLDPAARYAVTPPQAWDVLARMPLAELRTIAQNAAASPDANAATQNEVAP